MRRGVWLVLLVLGCGDEAARPVGGPVDQCAEVDAGRACDLLSPRSVQRCMFVGDRLIWGECRAE